MSNQQHLLEHDYDGIREYDNPMPGWWSTLFVVTILFAIGYVLYFDVLALGPNRLQDYSEEVAIQAKIDAAAEALFAISPEDLEKYVQDPAHIAAGSAKFQAICVACHGEKGEGKIGPNLTDNFWIHGGKGMDIYTTVRKGVPDKGMPVWGKTMKADEIRDLAAFVVSLRGKNLPGKEAQGQPFEGAAKP